MYLVFLKRFSIFSLIAGILLSIPVVSFLEPKLQLGVLGNYLIFFVLVLVSGLILLYVLMKDSGNFQTYTLAAMFIKMLIAIVYFYFVFETFKNDLLIFVGSFFLSYLLFTIFEVSFLVRFLRKKTEKAVDS